VIKQDARLWTIPTVVVTTAAQPHDIDVCYQLGVNSYMVKPMDCESLRYTLELLMRYWFSVVTLPARRSP
jgi:CheY-like chemotaxis protein